MLNFLKKKLSGSLANQYDELVRVMRVGLYEEFQRIISPEIAKQLTKKQRSVLAAQMMNFLEGEEKGVMHEQASPDTKKIIPQVKHFIEPCVTRILDNDSEIRKLVVYHLRVKVVVKFGLIGQPYMDGEEKKRIEELLLKYGKEYPEEAKFEVFSGLVHNFWEKRLQHKWPT